MPRRERGFDDAATDESGSAGDQQAHCYPSSTMSAVDLGNKAHEVVLDGDLDDLVEDLAEDGPGLLGGDELGAVGGGAQPPTRGLDEQRGPHEAGGAAEVRDAAVAFALEAVVVVDGPQVADERAAGLDERAQPGEDGAHVTEVVDGVDADDGVGLREAQ